MNVLKERESGQFNLSRCFVRYAIAIKYMTPGVAGPGVSKEGAGTTRAPQRGEGTAAAEASRALSPTPSGARLPQD